ncbi:MAG TPA: hypothetical protein VN281_19055 [Verrucomicrobiae bacterium]|nr:hypothetical protein [Verrucomicrobiae bacterium]
MISKWSRTSEGAKNLIAVSPGNVNLPIGAAKAANREIGVPRF